MSDIGENLRRLRGKMSQRKLAKLTGIQQGRISLIERGKSSLVDEFFLPITRALSITPNELLGITDDSEVEAVNDGSSVPLFDAKKLELFLQDRLPKEMAQKPTIPTDGKHSKMAYAVRVKGETMVPRFEPGDIAVIDPKVKAKGGNYVLVTDPENKTVIRLCKFVESDGEGRAVFDLVAIDGLSNPFRSTQNGVVIRGVVLEVRKRTLNA